jgi:hypothetical protein
MRDEGTKTIRNTSYWIVGGSFFIALFNLFLSRTSRSPLVPSSQFPQSNAASATVPLPNDATNPVLRAP